MKDINKNINFDNNFDNNFDFGNYYEAWNIKFYQTWLGIIVITFLVIFFIIAIIYLYKLILNLKNRSPESIAKKQLKMLLSDMSNRRLECHILYLRLTKILKNYVQSSYNFSKSGVTDLELFDYLKSTNCSKELLIVIDKLIKNAQEAKFAFINIDQENLKTDINNVILFINQAAKQKQISS